VGQITVQPPSLAHYARCAPQAPRALDVLRCHVSGPDHCLSRSIFNLWARHRGTEGWRSRNDTSCHWWPSRHQGHCLHASTRRLPPPVKWSEVHARSAGAVCYCTRVNKSVEPLLNNIMVRVPTLASSSMSASQNVFLHLYTGLWAQRRVRYCYSNSSS